MSDLDLSFATTKEAIEKPVKAGALDLSFATVTPNRSPAELAGQIITQQNEGGFPQGARNERGFFNKIGDVITGNDRETQATKQLPEFGSEASLKQMFGDDAGFGNRYGFSLCTGSGRAGSDIGRECAR